jgi:hypothetical protein
MRRNADAPSKPNEDLITTQASAAKIAKVTGKNKEMKELQTCKKDIEALER